jgi:two-component system NtrC family sensor kinase
MTNNLKKARDELEDWGRNLEAKVEDRTREVKQMQAQLARSEKLASLGELVAGIAHELNNPLTGVLVFSSLIRKDEKLHPELQGDIDVIVHETERCATIVKGLLDFSRESIPRKEPSSLNQIMDRTLTLVGHQSFFHDIEIRKDYSGDIPDVLVDPNQIEQVFINMLLNASQAMNGKGVLAIRTRVGPDGRRASIDISDTGCGIPEENLNRIFDPFFTTKANKGTGLGLSVSYGIIENHGGEIEVQSRMGAGTTFTILLPLPQMELAAAGERGEGTA